MKNVASVFVLPVFSAGFALLTAITTAYSDEPVKWDAEEAWVSAQADVPPLIVLIRHGRVKPEGEGRDLTNAARQTLEHALLVPPDKLCTLNHVDYYVVNISGPLPRFKSTYLAVKKSLDDAMQDRCSGHEYTDSLWNLSVADPGHPSQRETLEVIGKISDIRPTSNFRTAIFVLSGGLLRAISHQQWPAFTNVAEELSCKTDAYYYTYAWSYFATTSSTNPWTAIRTPLGYPSFIVPAVTVPWSAGKPWPAISRVLSGDWANIELAKSQSATPPSAAGHGGAVILAAKKDTQHFLFAGYGDTALSTPMFQYNLAMLGSSPSLATVRLGAKSQLLLSFVQDGALRVRTTVAPENSEAWTAPATISDQVSDARASMTEFPTQGKDCPREAFVAYMVPYENYFQACLRSSSDATTWSDANCAFATKEPLVSLVSYPVVHQARLFLAYVGQIADGAPTLSVSMSLDGKRWGKPSTLQSFGPQTKVVSVNLAILFGKLHLFFLVSDNPNIQYLVLEESNDGLSWGLGNPIPVVDERPIVSAISVP